MQNVWRPNLVRDALVLSLALLAGCTGPSMGPEEIDYAPLDPTIEATADGGLSAAAAGVSEPFRTGSLVAGGALYMLVPRPDDPQTILTASDVAGVHLSTDGGRTLTPANDGLVASGDVQVADVEWSTRTSDTASTAYLATSGGIFRRTGNGARWTRIGTFPCDGNSHDTPRQVGQLLATGGNYLFLGSGRDGALRWNGATWDHLGLAGSAIQGVSVAGSVLYVAVGNSGSNNGVWRITNATGTSPSAPSKMTGTDAPQVAWEVLAFAGQVWVGATGFVHRWDGTRWTKSSPGGNPSSVIWTALAGYSSGGAPRIVAGNYGDAIRIGGVTQAVYEFDGSRWTSLVSKVGAHEINCDPSMPLWTDNFARFGFPGFRNHKLTAVGGTIRAGIWELRRSTGDWCPSWNGAMVTGATNVAVDPSAPNHVYAATADYTLMHSTTYGVANPFETGIEKLHISPPAGTNGDRALSMAFDRSSAEVYFSTGDRNVGSNIAGNVYRFPRGNFGARTSIKSGLPDSRPWAIAVNRVTGGPTQCAAGSPIVIAALEAGGVYRKVGGASFARVTVGGGAFSRIMPDFGHATIEWPWNSRNVFLNDPQSGTFRSRDCGATWTQISTRASTDGFGGFIAYDAPGDTLYVSVANRGGSGNGVLRIAGASACTPSSANCTHTALSGVASRPGAIAVDFDGALWVAGLPTGAESPSMRYWTGAGWVDRTNAVYRGIGVLPLRIAIGRSGDGGQYVYVGFKGSAFVRARK